MGGEGQVHRFLAGDKRSANAIAAWLTGHGWGVGVARSRPRPDRWVVHTTGEGRARRGELEALAASVDADYLGPGE